MKRAPGGHALFSAFLLGLGLIAIYKAGALPIGTLPEPDAGLFPLATAIALSVLAGIAIATREPARVDCAPHRAGLTRVVMMVVAIAAYAWLLPRAGFLLGTLALLTFMLRALGRVGWTGTLVGGGVGAVACYFVFTRLGLPLPAGWFGF
jgi:hypothetical protein